MPNSRRRLRTPARSGPREPSRGTRRGRRRPATDEWVEWHRGYAARGLLARRLEVVQAQIRGALDAAPPGPIRVVSMCAGDGRDVLGVLRDHPRAADVRARLVELNPTLVRRGRARAARYRLEGVEFRREDASTTTAYTGAVPADLLLACGIFGNVTDADVRTTVDHLSELSGPGATVIWTRGRVPPDLTPTIRGWFERAGFAEKVFVPIAGTTASVGVHVLAAPPRRFRPGIRLFTFLPKEERPTQRARAPAPGRRVS